MGRRVLMELAVLKLIQKGVLKDKVFLGLMDKAGQTDIPMEQQMVLQEEQHLELRMELVIL